MGFLFCSAPGALVAVSGRGCQNLVLSERRDYGRGIVRSRDKIHPSSDEPAPENG